MDLAKALSVLGTNKGAVGEYIGVNLVKESPIPLLVMPTTAGSGSEVTRVAVLTDHKRKFKGGIVSPLIPPKTAIMDPSFLTTLPPRVIAETGIDALSHAIESFYSLGSNPISDILAKDAIRRITSNLRALVANPQNVGAAGNMLLGSMLAGAAFLNTGVGNVHALAHALGTYHHMSHALSVAVLLPYVMEHNLNACMERFAEMAAAMDANIGGLPLERQPGKPWRKSGVCWLMWEFPEKCPICRLRIPISKRWQLTLQNHRLTFPIPEDVRWKNWWECFKRRFKHSQ